MNHTGFHYLPLVLVPPREHWHQAGDLWAPDFQKFQELTCLVALTPPGSAFSSAEGNPSPPSPPNRCELQQRSHEVSAAQPEAGQYREKHRHIRICARGVALWVQPAKPNHERGTMLISLSTCDFWSHFCLTPNCFWNFFCRRKRSLKWQMWKKPWSSWFPCATIIPPLPNYNQRSSALRHWAAKTFVEPSVDQDVLWSEQLFI